MSLSRTVLIAVVAALLPASSLAWDLHVRPSGTSPDGDSVISSESIDTKLLREELDAQREELQRQAQTFEVQRGRLNRQEQALREQTRLIEEQRALLEWQQRQLNGILESQGAVGADLLSTLVGAGELQQDPNSNQPPDPNSGKLPHVSAPGPHTPGLQRVEPPEEKVGEAPQLEESPPEIPIIADVGGVLTPAGVLVIEPQVELVSSTVNRFLFQGIEVADAVLIGSIEASDADRNALVSSLTARLGLTSRFEIDARVPFVMRDDRVTTQVISQSDQATLTRDLKGSGIGDAEFGAHYQLNKGHNGMPFFIGNVRIKSDTGTSPFEVKRDLIGIETELATGSGFWTVEPSLTAIFPSDPAVFYGNLSYLYTFGRDFNEKVHTGTGTATLGYVDPGDAIGISFGMGLGLNRRASVNFGYDHDYIMKTNTEINRHDFESDELQVGSFMFGLSYGLTETTGVSLTLAVGATDDASDMQLSIRLPMTIELF